MTTNDDMRKIDPDALATKADLAAFTDDIKSHMGITVDDFKESLKRGFEGFAATLDRIERDLIELNKKVDVKFSDHDKILANHNERITIFEATERPSSGSV